MLLPEPKLSSDPLRHRAEGETWVAFSTEALAHTLAEIKLAEHDLPAWEALYGKWPGSGYLDCLRAGRDRLVRQLSAADEARR